MSVILQPQVAFPIVRQIANHLDATTYYVRAVVRNAQGSIIDTVDLTFQDNQRYQSSWRVPADPSGQGAYISIVTSVYTDSGYTTKSPDYGDEENTYLIFDRVMPAMRGGASGIDARTVRRIIQEELDKLPKPEKVVFPEIEIPEVRFDSVLSAIKTLETTLKPVPPEKLDFKPFFEAIESLRNDVISKEVTPPTDLEPLTQKLEDMIETGEMNHQEVRILLTQLGDALEKNMPEKFSEILKETTLNIAPTTATAQPKEREKEEEELFDLKKITA